MTAYKTATSNSLMARASTVVDGGRQGVQQAFVKNISSRRDRAGIQTLLSYVARMRDEDRESGAYGSVQLRNIFGQPLSMQMARTLVDSEWNLLAEEDNLSPQAIKLIGQGLPDQARALADKDRLRWVQAQHITWSLRKRPEDQLDLEAFTDAVAGGIVNSMHDGLVGERVIWAIHDDEPDRIHAHLIVHPEICPGSRINFNREYGHIMRRNFMDSLRAVGLDVAADCREDRADTRTRVMLGQEDLRPNKPMAKIKRNPDPAQCTPMWFIKHGLAYEKRRSGRELRRDQAAREVCIELHDFLNSHGERVDLNQAGVDGALRVAVSVVNVQLDRDLEARKQLLLLHRQFLESLRLRDRELMATPSSKKKGFFQFGRGSDPGREAKRDASPDTFTELVELVRDRFVDPEAAVHSWAEMAGEGAGYNHLGRLKFPNKSLASWHMRKNPVIFGEVTARTHEVDAAWDVLAKRLLSKTPVAPVHHDGAVVDRFDDHKEVAARGEALARQDKRKIDFNRSRVMSSLMSLANDLESRLGLVTRAEQVRDVALRSAKAVASGGGEVGHSDVAPGVTKLTPTRSPYRGDPSLRDGEER